MKHLLSHSFVHLLTQGIFMNFQYEIIIINYNTDSVFVAYVYID